MQWNEFSFTSTVVFEYDACIVPKPLGMTARSKVRPVDSGTAVVSDETQPLGGSQPPVVVTLGHDDGRVSCLGTYDGPFCDAGECLRWSGSQVGGKGAGGSQYKTGGESRGGGIFRACPSIGTNPSPGC